MASGHGQSIPICLQASLALAIVAVCRAWECYAEASCQHLPSASMTATPPAAWYSHPRGASPPRKLRLDMQAPCIMPATWHVGSLLFRPGRKLGPGEPHSVTCSRSSKFMRASVCTWNHMAQGTREARPDRLQMHVNCEHFPIPTLKHAYRQPQTEPRETRDPISRMRPQSVRYNCGTFARSCADSCWTASDI